MNWLKLADNKEVILRRGSLVRFRSSFPFEDVVIMMICESPGSSLKKGLMTISGFKAGINCYSVFPDAAYTPEGSLITEKIYDNWQNWVWPEGSPDDVWILPEGLNADDLK